MPEGWPGTLLVCEERVALILPTPPLRRSPWCTLDEPVRLSDRFASCAVHQGWLCVVSGAGQGTFGTVYRVARTRWSGWEPRELSSKRCS
jgi:hypothetical protein